MVPRRTAVGGLAAAKRPSDGRAGTGVKVVVAAVPEPAA